MTNSSTETDTRHSGTVPVASHPKSGTQAPPAKFIRNAGEPTDVAPRHFAAPEVFDLLVAALTELESAGKIATAAGLSARMRQLRPGFTIESTDFASFREITKAAESAGLVTSTRTPSDFVLELVQDEDFRGATLRPDLWRALQDWSDGVRYAYSRETRKTAPVGNEFPPNSVAVPSVDKATSEQWMQDFAASQQGALSALLQEALQETDPVAGFSRLTRDNSTIKRRWSKYLRNRVLNDAMAWARKNDIPRDHILSSSTLTPTPPPPLEKTVGNLRGAEEIDARRRVLAILESMPLHELLRLPIPLEYSLKR